MRDLERHLYLFTLDEHWRDHLYELDHLKGGIGLRAYGQRDPLIEYKKEAFTLFETLMRRGARGLRAAPVPGAAGARGGARRSSSGRAAARWWRSTPRRRRSAARRAGGDAGAAAATPRRRRRPRPAPVRSGPRVGRNDPCPCGSGKKYKKCHMLIDEGVGSGT